MNCCCNKKKTTENGEAIDGTERKDGQDCFGAGAEGEREPVQSTLFGCVSTLCPCLYLESEAKRVTCKVQIQVESAGGGVDRKLGAVLLEEGARGGCEEEGRSVTGSAVVASVSPVRIRP